MEKNILLTPDPICSSSISKQSNQVGSVVEFYGIVRGEENDQTISHLNYEAYKEMAEHQIHKILDELQPTYPCHSVHFIHRFGKIPVGEPSLWIRISSKHRKEGFGLLIEFCDRLKQDVPIWKSTEPS